MCGRFAFLIDWTQLDAQIEKLGIGLELGPGITGHPHRANIAPTQPIAVIYRDVDTNTARADLMRWGLVPVWVKDPADFPVIFNARAETLDKKPSFKGGLRHRRCLIPATGYYEWQRQPDGSKQPFFITSVDGQPLFFAGIYSDWMGPGGDQIYSAAIVTVAAGDDTSHIHDRTPALIPKNMAAGWLDVKAVSESEAARLLVPVPPGTLRAWPVSKRANSARNDSEDLVRPIDPETETTPAPKPEKRTKPDKSGQGELF